MIEMTSWWQKVCDKYGPLNEASELTGVDDYEFWLRLAAPLAHQLAAAISGIRASASAS